jgi:hypothetical protein
VYAGTDFAATSSSGLGFNDAYGNRYYGAWTTFKLPYKINLKKIHIDQFATSDGANARCAPEDGVILGSNNGVDWYHVHTFIGLQYGGSAGNPSYSAAGEDVTITCTTDYSQYALVITRTLHYDFTALIGELKWFGTPSSTTLDKGSLSLTRSLDVPRISRYDVDTETPRPEKLVVDFDTTVNSSPTDISGRGNHGTFYGTSQHYSPADKAFNFDGGGSYIFTSGIGNTIDNWVHSISVWVFAPAHGETIFQIGHALGGQHQNIGLETEATGKLRYFFYSNDVQTPTNSFPLNTWNHVVVTYDGGSVLTSRSVYINGVKQVINLVAGGTLAALDLQEANTGAYIGIQRGGGKPFYGKMSNFKIYNVALEPSEVQKLYRLGRTGRSMVISDTAVGIGKVPEAQLDVRGNLNVDGNIQINGFNAKRVLIGYQRYTNSTGVVYDNTVTAEQYQDAWSVTYTRKRTNSQIYIIADLCMAQAIGATSGTNYRDIDARLEVNDGVTDRYSDVTRDWNRIDSSFFEYMRQNRIHFGPERLPGGNTITIIAQLAQSAGSGTHTSWGLNIWGGRSFIEVFETMEA